MKRKKTKYIKVKKSNKTVLAIFNELGQMLCSGCKKILHPYMWVRGEGPDNIFKCACNRTVRVIYPIKKSNTIETNGKKT